MSGRRDDRKRYHHDSRGDNSDRPLSLRDLKEKARGNRRSEPSKRLRSSSSHDDRRSQKRAARVSQEPSKEEPPPEIKPNFELSGALARDTNTFNGIVVKYNQPPEAKKPSKHWRLYPFKGSEPLEFIAIHQQSAYLLGRERKVADIAIDHPSCSKQHAVIQFRCVTVAQPDGTEAKLTKPYIIDLDSANGTFVNGKRIEARRFVELLERDVIKFGFSSRDYVLLHEHSEAGSDS